MNVFDKAIAKIEDLEKSIYPTIRIVFENEKDVVMDYNVQKQMYEKGEDSEGNKITPEYTPYTKKLKRLRSQPIDRVTLRDEGDFHKAITIYPEQNRAVIKSLDVKTLKLLTKYGSEILGIQDEYLEEFLNDYILPELRKEFKKQIND